MLDLSSSPRGQRGLGYRGQRRHPLFPGGSEDSYSMPIQPMSVLRVREKLKGTTHPQPPARHWRTAAQRAASIGPCRRGGHPAPPARGSARRGTQTLDTCCWAEVAGAGSARQHRGKGWRGSIGSGHHPPLGSGPQPTGLPLLGGWLHQSRKRVSAMGMEGSCSEIQVLPSSLGSPMRRCQTPTLCQN